METKSKRMQRQKCDRMSALPDDILCHILSFLPTKYSFRTKILSTRWKYLFAFVPVLDFDYYTDTSDIDNISASEKCFANFVNRVFIMHNSPQLTRFRLLDGSFFPLLPSDFDSWISSAICRNVRELEIFVEFIDTKTFPQVAYSLPTDLPTFHRLTRLEIGEVSCTAFYSLPDIFRRCSLLEVLVFELGFSYDPIDDYDSDDEPENYIDYFKNMGSCVLVLKEIEFKEFAMLETECKLVEYFLGNARTLEKMKIQSNLSWKDQIEFNGILLTFSKCSKNCQIVIDWKDQMKDSDGETEDSQ